jgi:hypothetical protein
MNIRILFLVTFLIVSCKEKKQKDMRIFENTKEFMEVQNSSEVTFEQAKMLFIKYHNENEFKELDILFYYFENGYYYFGYKTDPTHDKQNRSWYFLEAKVNAKTGEIVKEDKQIEWTEIENEK